MCLCNVQVCNAESQKKVIFERRLECFGGLSNYKLSIETLHLYLAQRSPRATTPIWTPLTSPDKVVWKVVKI